MVVTPSLAETRMPEMALHVEHADADAHQVRGGAVPYGVRRQLGDAEALLPGSERDADPVGRRDHSIPWLRPLDQTGEHRPQRFADWDPVVGGLPLHADPAAEQVDIADAQPRGLGTPHGGVPEELDEVGVALRPWVRGGAHAADDLGELLGGQRGVALRPSSAAQRARGRRQTLERVAREVAAGERQAEHSPEGQQRLQRRVGRDAAGTLAVRQVAADLVGADLEQGQVRAPEAQRRREVGLVVAPGAVAGARGRQVVAQQLDGLTEPQQPVRASAGDAGGRGEELGLFERVERVRAPAAVDADADAVASRALFDLRGLFRSVRHAATGPDAAHGFHRTDTGHRVTACGETWFGLVRFVGMLEGGSAGGRLAEKPGRIRARIHKSRCEHDVSTHHGWATGDQFGPVTPHSCPANGTTRGPWRGPVGQQRLELWEAVAT